VRVNRRTKNAPGRLGNSFFSRKVMGGEAKTFGRAYVWNVRRPAKRFSVSSTENGESEG